MINPPGNKFNDDEWSRGYTSQDKVFYPTGKFKDDLNEQIYIRLYKGFNRNNKEIIWNKS